MAAGKEPFDAIMGAVGGLKAGEEFELFAPLDPIPLYQVLGAQGYSHETEALGGGTFGSSFARRWAEMAIVQSRPLVGRRALAEIDRFRGAIGRSLRGP
jgi:uncharacterized protein (DUF2249 family)